MREPSMESRLGVTTMNVLLVDDEESIRSQLGAFLESLGYGVVTAGDGAHALAALDTQRFDVALIDLRMPDMGGLELAERLLERSRSLVVLVMTAFGTVETAVASMRAGVHDFLLKPLRREQLEPKLAFIAQKISAERELERLQGAHGELGFGELLGASAPMRAVFQRLALCASSELPVLLVGETGTGKDLAARAVHEHSPRKQGPFLPINCGAIPESLAEAELFGHVAGAFTGAGGERAGKLSSAHQGTVFLDELTSSPRNLQVKLLRVLEDHTFTPLGSDTPQRVDVRIIAATNEDPEEAVRRGRLREDLYYRLNVLRVDMPPLRAHPEDIPILAQHLLARSRHRRGARPPGVSADLMEALMGWSWPGNVRQLQNVLESAAVGGAEVLELSHLPPSLLPSRVQVTPRSAPPGDGLSLAQVVAEVERATIREALVRTGGKVGEAAAQLKITERGLRRKIHKLHIDLKGLRQGGGRS